MTTNNHCDALRNEESARFVYEDVPVSRADAQTMRRDAIRCAVARLREASEELFEARNAPLVTTRTNQIRLLPGDPGYDEAPVAFDPARYQGESSWWTHFVKI